ncbi:MAG TPA: PocR ligand-binding domain-containing protein [Bacteroidales bacterium]|nr:PocR ligand-binding domain-containing protein [Bacteroidales bacterium]
MELKTKTQQHRRSIFSARFFVLIFAILTLFLSLMDLLGWTLDITLLKSLGESWVPMKVPTAICFIFASVAIIIIEMKYKWRFIIIIPVFFGILIFICGLLSSWVHMSLLLTGTENLLSRDPFFDLFLSNENRMALLTAVNFSFLGIIIILLSFHLKKMTGIAHAIILPVLAVSYLIPVTYLLGVLSLHTINHLSVALNSGIALTSICLAVLFVNTKSWFMRVFTSHNSGGLMARRLLPWMLILPIVIAWIRMYGERKDFFESDVGVLLVALTYTICLVVLTWISARSVNRIDKKRRAADEAKGRSEDKLQAIFTSMNEGLVYYEVFYENGKAADYTILDVNPAYERITGRKREVAIGTRATKIYNTEHPPHLDVYAEVAGGAGPQRFETYSPVLGKYLEVSVFSPEKGKFATIFSDISSRKKAETVLQESHEELETLVAERTIELTRANSLLEAEIFERKKAEDGITAERKRFNDVLELLPAYLILLSKDYKVPYANKFFRERFGESHGKRCFEYLFNRTEPCEVCETYKVFKTGLPLTWEWTGPDRRKYSIYDFPFTDVDGSTMVMEMGIDITELKQKEAEIKELNTVLEQKVFERTAELIKANDQHKKSQEMAHLGSWELDLKTNKLIWSDEVFRIFGMKPQEHAVTYGEFLESVHPDDRELVDNAYTESIKNGLDNYEVMHRVLNKINDTVRYVHEKCEHIRDEAGIIIRSVGMIHDITEQVETNEKLKQSEEKVRLKLQSILSPEGDISSLELSDILDIPSVQSLMDNFHKLTHIPMAMIDLKGKVFVKAGWQEICTKYHRNNPETFKNCIQSDLQLSGGIPEGEFKLYKCKNNLWDMATPIIIGGEQKGNLFMGQFFFDDEKPDIEYFKNQAKKYGFNEHEYLKMLDKVPRINRSTINYAKELFLNLASSLSTLSYSNIKLARSISEQERIGISLQKNNIRLDILSYTASQLLSSTNPRLVVNELCTRVMKFLDCQVFFNYMVDEKAGKLYLNACEGIPDETKRTIEWLEYGIAVCGRVANSGKRIIAENIQESNDPITELVKSFGVKAYCCHPILSKGNVIGTLSFGTSNRCGFTEEDIAMMSAVTDQVSIALTRVRNEAVIRESEENYHKLFEFSAIPIWKEDFSEIKKFFDQLKHSGVNDFRKYFEEHRDDVIFLSSLVKVVDINHKSVEFYGAANKEAVNKNMLAYFNEDSFDVFREELIALASGEKQFECEMPMKTLSGDVKLLNLHLSVVNGFEDTLSNVLVSFIDITERKRIENELKEKNDALKESNATKDKFFKIIAHDMKNPFISILGASELLSENVNNYDLPKIAEFARIMNDSAKGGYDMLINLLSWAKSQAGSMIFQPEKINLIELIDRNLSNLNEFANNKNIRLIYDIAGGFEVLADKNMLITILRNLITNALKYTPKDGEVIVSAKVAAGETVILIKDTGVGIKENDFDKLFRSDIKFSLPGTDHEGGTGLGLILCKELVEKHSGEIWVESEVGKGSVFYFTIPAMIEQPKPIL